jgi:hypothetical protein
LLGGSSSSSQSLFIRIHRCDARQGLSLAR